MPSLTNFNGEALMTLGDMTPAVPLTVNIHGRISNEQVSSQQSSLRFLTRQLDVVVPQSGP